MELESVQLYRVRIPFKRTFEHASAVRREAENLLLCCTLTNGVSGWGETIARDYVTGETTDSAIQRLHEVPEASWRTRFASPHDLAAFHDGAGLSATNVARCGVEIALLDAFARVQRQPLYKLLASTWPELARIRNESFVRYGGPFGLSSAGGTIWTAARLRLFGFRDVKLKVSMDSRVDRTRVRLARAILGRAVDLRVDANEAWNLEHALAMVPTLKRYGISAVEQPFSKRADDLITEFAKRADLPIIADESLCDESAAHALRAKGTALLFAVKLAKLGGFLSSLRILALAEQWRVGVQIGCQVGESAILSAAGRHLAALCPNLRYLEGSHDRFLLTDNVSDTDITFGWGGVAPVLKGPGLGIEVDLRRVERHAEQTFELFRRADAAPHAQARQATEVFVDTRLREDSQTGVAAWQGDELSVQRPSLARHVRGSLGRLFWFLTWPLAALRAWRSERKEKPFTSSVEVVLMRALGVRDLSVRGADVLAHHFLPPRYQLALPLGSVGARICDRIAPGCYGYHNARTKHFDAVIEAEAAAGMEQLVLLGAGNDSRPYRMREALRNVRVFELDLPNTQERKIRLVKAMCGTLPQHVSYLPIDFEKEAFGGRLLEGGFDPARKTLFSWEGVSYYLTEAAAKSVLETMHGLSIPGGGVIFDYSLRSFNEGRLQTYGGEQLTKWLAKRGMRYQFGAEAEEMCVLLAELGFDLLSDVGPQELEQKLRVRQRGPDWRVWSNFRIAHLRARGQAVARG